MKNNIETSLTVVSMIASVIGMFFIATKTWQFLSEHFDEMHQLVVKLI